MADSPTPHSPAVEDYIKQIYKLTSRHERATTKALAERMGLGQGTVSGMLKQLAARGLASHRPYYGVTLTDAGHRLALTIIRRHRLIELFLVETLGLGWEEVDRDAERLEHAFSDRLIDKIDAFLGHPDVDPHGAPIPDPSGQLEPQDYRRLAELDEGEAGRVRRVSDREPKFLEHLRSHGIRLGTEVRVVSVDPFGSMQLDVEGRQTHLAREATERIQVSRD